MTSSGLRERKRQQTYDAIILAALDLFERDGFEATTVEDIADAAGISPRTFFRYFDSKVALVIDKDKHNGKHDGNHDDNEQGSAQDEFGALLLARPPGESPVDSFHHLVRDALVPMLTNDCEQRVRRFRVAMKTPSLRILMVDHLRAHQVDMVRSFAARLGTDENDLAPRVMAAAFSETLWAIIERWVTADADPERLPVLVDEAFDLLRSGFAQRPPP